MPDGTYQNQFPTTSIRDVGLEAGNPAAYASLGNKSATSIAESDQSQIFGLAVMDLLKQYQGIEKQPFARQELDAQSAQASRAAYTPPELIGASPSLQAGARNAAVGALDPTIQGARVAGQTFGSQLSTFNDILGQAKGFLAEQANAEAKKRDDARAIVNTALSAGSEAFQGLLDQQPQLLKVAGIDPETAKFFVNSLKAKESQKGAGDTGRVRDDERALQQIYLNQPIVKGFNEQLQKKLSVDSIINSGVGGPADLALVYEFMKALDPSSVVRETEYATAAKSGNIFSGVFARFNGYFKEKGGFLPPQVKQAFQDLVNRKFRVQETLYNNFRNQFREQAKRQGLEADNVTTDFGAAIPQTTSKGGRTFEVIPD